MILSVEEAKPSALAGTEFPSGTFRIDSWRDVILRDLVDAPPAVDGVAHPAWVYIAAQAGIGIDVDGILELADATAKEGPMVASIAAEFAGDLRIDVQYEVSGRVVGLERKVGRTLGVFDLYTFELELREPDAGSAIATLTAAWVLPRRALGDA